MVFLVRYVVHIHNYRHFKTLLANNEGTSYIDLLTASDIGFAITLLKNALKPWRSRKANEGTAIEGKADKDAKMLFSAGENVKRDRGKSTWTKEGRIYFKTAENVWKRAYTSRGTEDYKKLRKHWNHWIENDGKGYYMVGGKEGTRKKSIYSILHTVPKGETSRLAAARKKAIALDEEEEEEFVYMSDEDDDNNVSTGSCEKDGGDNEGDEDASSGDSAGEDDDDGDGGGKMGPVVQSEEDESEDERSLNGIQELTEDEALSVGMTNVRKRKASTATVTAVDRIDKQVKTRGRGGRAKFGQVLREDPAVSKNNRDKTKSGRTVTAKKR